MRSTSDATAPSRPCPVAKGISAEWHQYVAAGKYGLPSLLAHPVWSECR
jgi:hypothetical protein